MVDREPVPIHCLRALLMLASSPGASRGPARPAGLSPACAATCAEGSVSGITGCSQWLTRPSRAPFCIAIAEVYLLANRMSRALEPPKCSMSDFSGRLRFASASRCWTSAGPSSGRCSRCLRAEPSVKRADQRPRVLPRPVKGAAAGEQQPASRQPALQGTQQDGAEVLHVLGEHPSL